MTDRELLQQALDALDYYITSRQYVEDIYVKAYEAIRTRLAQPEWVGLTDEERYLGDARTEQEIEYAKGIEAKLKEKNSV
jgi:hypothetical protein